MKHYKAICFDFDYTLADCTDSIVDGFANGMTKLGHPVPDRETVRKTVGYMLEDAYTMISGDDSPEGRAKFRPYFIEVALERQRRETTLFPGAVEVIRGLKDKDNTMIVVTHEMEFAKSVADVVIYMADGVIEEMGTPEEVFDYPRSEKTRSFIGGTQHAY